MAARASAAPPAGYALHWVRAEGAERCIDPRALAARVEALTGPVFVAPAAAEISFEGEIAPDGRGFRARLVSSRADGVPRGERILNTSSADCRALDAALAFVIALTIDPSMSLAGVPADVLGQFAQEVPPEQALLSELSAQSASAAPTAAAPLAASAEVPAAPSLSETAHQAQATRFRAPRYAVVLAAATLGRSMPDWRFGLRGSFSFDPLGFMPFVLSASAFPGDAPQALSSGQSASFQTYDAALSACPGLSGPKLSAYGCLGFALGYQRAHGNDFDPNFTIALWDPALMLGVSFAVPLWRGLGLAVDAMMRVRLTSRGFAFRQPDQTIAPAHDPPRLGLLFSLGPRYAF
jgi:hypothetical protein